MEKLYPHESETTVEKIILNCIKNNTTLNKALFKT